MRLFFAFLILLISCSGLEARVITLKYAIERALSANPEVRMQMYERLASQYGLKAAKSDRFFKLSFSYSYTRLNEDKVIELPTITFPPPIGTVDPGDILLSKKDIYEMKFTAVQPIYTGGLISSGIKAQKAKYMLEKYKEKETELELIYRVKELYINILKAEKIKKLVEKMIESLNAHYRDAEKFYKNGLVPKIDLLKAEVAISSAEYNLSKAEANLKIAKIALMKLLTEDVKSNYEVEDIVRFKPFSLDEEECVQKALKQRPIMKIAEAQLDLARAQAGIVKSEFLPHIFLAGEYTRQGDSPECNGDGINDPESWSVRVWLKWDVFEWGKSMSKYKKAKMLYRKAIEAKRKIETEVEFEVKKAYYELKAAQERIFSSQKAIEEARENYRIARLRYREQIGTSTDVIEAQYKLTQAEINYYTALCDYNIALSKLKRVMGEKD